jgi:hypothetical protein
MALTVEDQCFIAWFRSLRAYDRLVIYGWLLTGDAGLLAGLWGRMVDGQQHQFFKVAAAER